MRPEKSASLLGGWLALGPLAPCPGRLLGHALARLRNFVRAADSRMDFHVLVVSKALLRVGLAQKLMLYEVFRSPR